MFDSAIKTDSLLKIYYVKNIYYNIKQEKIKLGKLKSLIYLSEGKFFLRFFKKGITPFTIKFIVIKNGILNLKKNI